MEDFDTPDKDRRSLTPEQAKAKAQSYCAYQERSQQEVRDKLYQWGLHPADVEASIADLIADNFLNEERFALAYASGKFRMNGWGRRKIEQGLQQKAVSLPLIRMALDSLDSREYRRQLQKILTEKARTERETNPYKRKHKLLRHAIGKGYEGELALQILTDNEL